MRAETRLHVTWDQGMGGKLWKSGREESLHPEAGSGGREGPARPRPEFWEDFVEVCKDCRPSLAAT